MALQWTTNRQFTAPSAADGVSVTPNNTAWANSSWFELLASVSADSVFTGINFRTQATANLEFEIDVGTGNAGVEVVKATIKGNLHASGTNCANGMYVPFPIPIAAIASGVRIACRMRTSGGSTTAWVISATYLKLPITGTLLTTTKASEVIPSAAGLVSVQTGVVAWDDGAWTQLTASIADAIVVIGLVIFPNSNSLQFEVDLGMGNSPNEVLITTLKGVGSNGGSPYIYTLPNPIDVIPELTRIVARTRGNRTAYTIKIGFIYHRKPL